MTGPPGPGVDAQGLPVIDPTANVLALVTAAMQRQDDLREMESAHLRALIDRDASHANELRIAEAARLDAIRVVDVNAVQRAAEVAQTQAATLANVVAASAEALRTQVATTATAMATALAAALDPVVKDIADLRKTQFQQQGEREQRSAGRGSNQWVVATAISALVALLSVASFVFYVSR